MMTLVESALAELHRQDGDYKFLKENFDQMVKSYIRACNSGELSGPIKDALPKIVQLVTRATATLSDYDEREEEKMNLLQQSIEWAYNALDTYDPSKGTKPTTWIIAQVEGRLKNNRRDEYAHRNRMVPYDTLDNNRDEDSMSISSTDEENPYPAFDTTSSPEDDASGETPFARPDDVMKSKEDKTEIGDFLDSVSATPDSGKRDGRKLSPLERKIIELSFGLGDANGESLDLDAISDQLGLSYAVAKSLKSRALSKLRSFRGRLSDLRDSVDPSVSKIAGEILEECMKVAPRGTLLKG